MMPERSEDMIYRYNHPKRDPSVLAIFGVFPAAFNVSPSCAIPSPKRWLPLVIFFAKKISLRIPLTEEMPWHGQREGDILFGRPCSWPVGVK